METPVKTMKYNNCDFYVLIFSGLILAFTFDDLSYKKVAFQSSRDYGLHVDGKAVNAVDRNTSTCMKAQPIGISSSFIHNTVWWKVHLGELYSIYSINIIFKNYAEYDNRQRGRFAGFSLYVSETGDIHDSTLCYKDGPDLPPLNFTTTCTEYGYVVIFYNERLNGVTYPKEYEVDNVFIELCEVIVYGCRLGFFGINCDRPCPTNCKDYKCHVVKGTCFECNPGWIGILCKTNDLSYKKVASQLHTFPGTSYDAGNAVDRDISTCMKTREIGLNSPDKTVWWKVDFGGVYNIYSINILFKNYNGSESRQRGRFAGFSLYVSITDVSTTTEIKNSTLCYKDEPHLPPLNFTKICTSRGRYVIFYNERMAGVSYPAEYQLMDVLTELCEVVVQGCKMPGVYGSKCDNLCPINCKDSACHVENETCFGCKPGWMGTSCDMKCKEGLYGFNCSQQCLGHCRDTISCNHVTGVCDDGCTAGWAGTFCEEACQRGYYGTNCSLTCSPNCKTCRPTDGLCSCKAGWMGHSCSEECIQSYGENCQYPCSGQCINMTCDRFTGNCWCDFKHANLWNFETTDDAPSSTVWIIAFSISLVIHIIFISATLISRRKTLLKRKSTRDKVDFAWRSGSNTVQTATTDNPSHYQELRVSKDDNTYQTLQ